METRTGGASLAHVPRCSSGARAHVPRLTGSPSLPVRVAAAATVQQMQLPCASKGVLQQRHDISTDEVGASVCTRIAGEGVVVRDGNNLVLQEDLKQKRRQEKEERDRKKREAQRQREGGATPSQKGTAEKPLELFQQEQEEKDRLRREKGASLAPVPSHLCLESAQVHR